MTPEQQIEFVRYVVLRCWNCEQIRRVGDVDDAIQIGHMAILRAHDKFDPNAGRRYEWWAWSVVRNALLDEGAKVCNRPMVQMGYPDGIVSDDAPQRDEDKDLAAAMERLTPEQRQAVHSRFYRTTDATAASMSLNKRQLRRLAASSLDRLRDELVPS